MSSRHDEGWDRIYHRYRPEDLPWELGRPRKSLIELVDSGLVKPCKTLDLCCGTGTNPVYLATKGFEVTALDISDRAVQYAEERACEAETDIDFLVADFVNLPFRREAFGFVFDFGCFHHVEVDYRVPFIAGVYRVLKSKGSYFMTCFSYMNGHAWNHSAESRSSSCSKAILRSTGSDTFHLLKVIDIPLLLRSADDEISQLTLGKRCQLFSNAASPCDSKVEAHQTISCRGLGCRGSV